MFKWHQRAEVRIILIGIVFLTALTVNQFYDHSHIRDVFSQEFKNHTALVAEQIESSIIKFIFLSESGGGRIKEFLAALDIPDAIKVEVFPADVITAEYDTEGRIKPGTPEEAVARDGQARNIAYDDHYLRLVPLTAVERCAECHHTPDGLPVPEGYTMGVLKISVPSTVIKKMELGTKRHSVFQFLTLVLLLGLYSSGTIWITRRLRDSESRFRTIASSAYDAVVMMDHEGKITFWNESAERMFGHPRESAMGQNLHEFIVPPEFRDAFLRGMGEFRKSGRGGIIGRSLEIPAVRGDGTIFHAEHSISSVMIGGSWHAIGIIRDATERKAAEEALRRSEEKYRKLMETANDAIFLADAETGLLMDANEKAEELMGIPLSEIKGLHQSALHPAGEEERYAALFRRHAETGGVVTDVFIERRDGRKVPVDISVSFFEIEGKRIVQGTFRNVEERKQYEEKIQRQNEFLVNVLESLSHPFYVIDAASYEVLQANSAAIAQKLPERPVCYALFHGQDRPCEPPNHLCPIEEIKRTKKPVVLEHVHFSNGDRRVIELHAHPVLDGSGNVVQIIEYSLDITERKAVEREISYRLTLETALAETSRMLLTIEEPDLSRILEFVGKTVGVNRAYIFLMREHVTRMDNTHEWCAPGAEPQIQNLQNLDPSVFPWWMEKLNRKEDIVINDVEALPPEASAEREILKAQGIRSLLVVPLSFKGGKLLGFIGFDDTEKTRDWRDGDLQSLHVLAEMVSLYFQHKRHERDLRLFQSLVNRTSDAIFIVEPESGRFLDANERACANLGYARDEILKLKVPDIETLLPDGESWKKLAFEMKKEGFFIFEGRQRRKDGTTFPVEMNMNYVVEEKREYVVAVARDITERKRAMEDLKEREARYRAVTESAMDAIISADGSGRIIGWNGGAERTFGHTKDEAIGAPITMLMPREYRKPHREAFMRYISTGETSILGKKVEVEGLGKDGATFPVEVSLSTWKIGSEVFFTAIMHNITERKAREKELQRRNEELKNTLDKLQKAQSLLVRSEKLVSIGTLSAGVAHEILNPLNIISTIAQMMMMEDLPEAYMENMEDIMLQVARATKITNNLRMFAHQKKTEIAPVNLHVLFDKTASLIEHDLNLENILIERRFDAGLPEIMADGDQLAQVFLNLLNNAKDAMKGRKGNVLTVAFTTLSDGVEMRFTDNGPGIPKKYIGKLFDPFFTTKPPGQGTGLGLSLVYSIIESHGGSIRAESEEGQGATFVIFLPLKNPLEVEHVEG